ncbi:hypothetical protein ACH4KN_27060 [Streptomyces sp. NPDC017546]|uniref:hypothetical protein n=1 Tax=Streptomyces sp. NPDC017546 TaxID=3365001 RepID=UPI00378DECA2
MTLTAPSPLDATDRRLLLQNEASVAVQAGTYKVAVATEVAGHGVSGARRDASHELTVAGPRFALEAAAVESLYPPPGSSADYRQTMAHLALTEPSLPWQRSADAGSTPWLALVVLSATDLRADPVTGKTWVECEIKDFLAECAAPKDGVLLPTLGPEELPKGVTLCRTVEMSAEVFTDVLPRLGETAKLVFVRRVREDADRAWADGTTGPGKATEHATSVVLSARLPHTAGDYSAHLISLEGMGAHLHGTWPLTHRNTTVRTVKMLSLYSWSFHHDPDAKGSFEDAVKELATRSGNDLLLRLPVPGGSHQDTTAGAAARKRLSAGYVPVAHRLPTGERTVAWYRGPFTPVLPAPPPFTAEKLTCETNALAYEPEHGLFDVSYSSAFALGRFLTLADPALNQALTLLRKDALATVHTAVVQGAARHGPDGPAAREALARARTAPAPSGPGSSPRVARHLRATGSARRDLEALLAARMTRAASAPTPVPALEADGEAAQERADVRAELRAVLRAPQGSALAGFVSHVVDVHAAVIDDSLCARKLLQAVPLDHLVPDPRLLPEESIRLFAVDGTWLSTMVAGAVQMGQATSLDHSVGQHLRRRLLSTFALPKYGMLVRSRVVRDWPALIIEAVDGTLARPVLFSPPRRLAPDLLLAHFTAAPGRIVLRRPAEQPHYGLDGEDTVKLRNLADARHLGQTLHNHDCGGILDLRRTGCATGQPTETLTVLTEDATRKCLNRALRNALSDQGQWYTDEANKNRQELTAAEMGLQLLDTTARLVLSRADDASDLDVSTTEATS